MSIPSEPPKFEGYTGVRGRAQDTVTVYKKITKGPNKGDWETVALDDVQKQTFEGILNTIRKTGESTGASASFKRLDMKGTQFVITKEGIVESIKGLEFSRAFGKQEIKKTMEAVSTYFGAEVKLEVSVKGEKFEAISFEAHNKFHDNLLGKQVEIEGAHFQSWLKGCDFANDEIEDIYKKWGALVYASQQLKTVFNEINTLLDAGDKKEALTYGNENLATYYRDFTEETRAWQQTEWKIESKAHQNPYTSKDPLQYLHVEPQHIEAMSHAARGFLTFADPEGNTTANSIFWIHESAISFANYQQLAQKSMETIEGILATQGQFLAEVQHAIAALGNDYGDKRREHNLTEQQYKEHKEALQDLQKNIETFRRMITENTWAALHEGRVQEGVNAFAKGINGQIESYRVALEKVRIAQKVAQGRNLGRRPLFNQVNLKQIAPIQEALRHFSHDSAAFPCKDAKGTLLVDNTPWNQATLTVAQAQADHLEAQKFKSVTGAFELHHEDNLRLTEQIGRFVKVYNTPNGREEFEWIMRQSGVSEAECAWMFNHYTDIHKLMQQRNGVFQEVVDLANQKNYDDALAKYTELVNGELTKSLIEVGIEGALRMQHLQQSRVEAGLSQFAIQEGLPSAKLFIQSISLQNLGGRPLSEVDGVMKYVSEDQKGALEKAKATAQQQLTELTEKVGEQEQLLQANDRFKNFFYPNDLTKTQSKGCRDIAKISLNQITTLNRIAKSYATLIRPLQDLQEAVQSEQNPQKLRALQLQLKQKALSTRVEQEKLRKEYQKLGGEEFFDRVVNFATHVGTENKNLNDGLTAEAKALRSLMGKRLAFFEELYVEVGIKPAYQKNLVKESLSSKNNEVNQLLTKHRPPDWDDKKIADFNTFFDQYQEVADRFKRAKKEYEIDPENPHAQEVYKKEAKALAPRLSHFQSAFQKDYSDAGNMINNGLEACKESEGEENVVAKEKLSIRMNLARLGDGIKEVLTLPNEAKRIASEPMSWESDYLSALTKQGSDLRKVEVGQDGQKFSGLLKEKGVNLKDLKEINQLHQEFQKHLREITLLERRLEAAPENEERRQKLVAELKKKNGKMQQLNAKYKKLEAKIQGLDAAVLESKNYLAGKAERTTKEEAVLGLVSRLPYIEGAFNQKWVDVIHTYTRFQSFAFKKTPSKVTWF